MACAVPPTGYLTSPSLPRPTRCGCRTSHLPLANVCWAYLCAFQNMGTKHVVGWHVGHHVRRTRHDRLAADFYGAAAHPRPTRPLGPRWAVLWQRLPRPLAPARGGALAEPAQRLLRQRASRWSRLKTEVLELREWPVFADLADAQASVVDYFDYYNHERRHSSIGYHKPYQFH